MFCKVLIKLYNTDTRSEEEEEEYYSNKAQVSELRSDQPALVYRSIQVKLVKLSVRDQLNLVELNHRWTFYCQPH